MQLGDRYYHNGRLHGVPDADERALDAFLRALELDSLTATNPNAEPLMHLDELGLNGGDTAMVRRLLTLAIGHASAQSVAVTPTDTVKSIVSTQKGKRVTLDFNLAYNPNCADGSDRYSCPIPPKENFLQLRVTAGELDHKHPAK